MRKPVTLPVGAAAPKKAATRTASAAKLQSVSREYMHELFLSVGQKLREGLSSEAECILASTIKNFSHTPDDLANLKRLLSFTLETAGRYKQSLEAVKTYENEESLDELSIETQVRVTTQLAIAYNNMTD